jgi:hypothetical protein
MRSQCMARSAAHPLAAEMGVARSELKTFRCRMRASGTTSIIECLAPSAEAAAWVVVKHALERQRAPWVQVVVAEWSGVLGEFIDPGNALIITPRDLPPPGTDRVVFSRAEFVSEARTR